MIRRALREDLPRVAAFAGALVRQHHGFDDRRFFLPERVEEGYAWWFGKELPRDEVVLLVAEKGADLVGYIYARMEERDYNALLDRHAAIHDIFVVDAERRSGVATLLLRGAIAALEAKGAPRVVLHTATANVGAQKFFAKHGFRSTMIEMTREAG